MRNQAAEGLRNGMPAQEFKDLLCTMHATCDSPEYKKEQKEKKVSDDAMYRKKHDDEQVMVKEKAMLKDKSSPNVWRSSV